MKPDAVGNVSPSKFQTYLSHSLPIIYIGPPSDISSLILEYNAGYVISNGDSPSFIQTIRHYLTLPQYQKRYS